MTQTIRPYIINVDGQKKLRITYIFASRNFPDLSYSYLCKDIQLNYEKTPAQETLTKNLTAYYNRPNWKN